MKVPAVIPIVVDLNWSQVRPIRCNSSMIDAQLFANWGTMLSMFAIDMMVITIPRAIDNAVSTKLINTAFSLYLSAPNNKDP